MEDTKNRNKYSIQEIRILDYDELKSKYKYNNKWFRDECCKDVFRQIKEMKLDHGLFIAADENRYIKITRIE